MLAGADLADPEAVRAMVDGAAAALGSIDVLVNNAGVVAPHAIDETSYEDWQRAWRDVLAVNLTGAANVDLVRGAPHGPRRADRERLLARRLPRRAVDARLRREQGRDRLARPVAGALARPARDRGHQRGARLHRDRHGGGRAGGRRARAAQRGEPARAGSRRPRRSPLRSSSSPRPRPSWPAARCSTSTAHRTCGCSAPE